MTKEKIICAALAAVMTASMVGGCAVSAEGLVSVNDDTSVLTAPDGEYKKVDESFGNDEKYKEYTEHGCKVRDDGLVYKTVSEDGESCIDIIDYIGGGEELVIPAEIDGMTVGSISGSCYLGDGVWEEGLYELPTLRKLVIEAPVKSMVSVFADCEKLETVVLPDTLSSIEGNAFTFCPSLKEVNIPASLEFVNGPCFRYTPWLEEKEEKEKLVVIGRSLLSARKAEGKVTVPKNVSRISSYAFEGNHKMTELNISGNVEFIDYCGWDCRELRKITLKNGVKTVKKSKELDLLPKLEKIVIPPSLTKSSTENLLVTWDDGSGEWVLNKNCTYYYYKGTKADKVLNSKKYKGLKKSVLPGKTKSISVSAKKNAAKVTWKSVSTATGYQIQVSPAKTFKKGTRTATVDGKTKTSRSIKRLTSGKKYYVRMRTYKTLSGQRYYGNYTKIRSVKVK